METEMSGKNAFAFERKASDDSPMRHVLSNRNFQLLWLGQGLSLVGDQFYMIALPWLVLMMTGDAAQLGLVLALTGAARVALMLFGGALSDRFSQRSVMLASDALRLGMMAGLAIMVLSGGLQVWMIYLFAVAFGAVSGVFMPAAESMIPRIVGKDELMIGNTIEQVTSQVGVFVGPLLAGGLLAWFAGSGVGITGDASPAMGGIGVAFAVDALTFLISIATLLMMRIDGPGAEDEGNMLAAIGEGIAFVARSRKILLMFVVMALINFLFTGPFLVGVPVLASDRLPEGAAAFGLLMAALALGSVPGAIAAGVIRTRPADVGLILTGCIAVFGLGMAALGLIGSTWEGVAVLFAVGILNGYVVVVIITLLQNNTPSGMLGRLMSLVMIAGMGLLPASQALAGFAFTISPEGVFAGCGVLILATAAMVALSRDFREIGIQLPSC